MQTVNGIVTQHQLNEVVALATVLVRQTDRLHVLLGEINDLRCSRPTLKQVEELSKTFEIEKDFAHYALKTTNDLLEKL